MRRNLEPQLDLMDAMNVVSTNSELRHGRQYPTSAHGHGCGGLFPMEKPPANYRLRQMGLYRDNLRVAADHRGPARD